jgi:hypothetical protein
MNAFEAMEIANKRVKLKTKDYVRDVRLAIAKAARDGLYDLECVSREGVDLTLAAYALREDGYKARAKVKTLVVSWYK